MVILCDMEGTILIGPTLAINLKGYGSLHSSVTSQPKPIGHFTAYPKQIEFDIGHFTAYYLLVGVCCPRGFDLCCEFDLFYRSI